MRAQQQLVSQMAQVLGQFMDMFAQLVAWWLAQMRLTHMTWPHPGGGGPPSGPPGPPPAPPGPPPAPPGGGGGTKPFVPFTPGGPVGLRPP